MTLVMSFILSLAIFCATRGGFHGRDRNFGVCHATFGYGRPPRSVGPLGLAVEIVSMGYGPNMGARGGADIP